VVGEAETRALVPAPQEAAELEAAVPEAAAPQAASRPLPAVPSSTSPAARSQPRRDSLLSVVAGWSGFHGFRVMPPSSLLKAPAQSPYAR
jgi:hypothetical protein